jgi:hypothetical protein
MRRRRDPLTQLPGVVSSDHAGGLATEEHEARCEQAGCQHPAVRDLGDGFTVLGWCVRCRALGGAA